MDGLMRPFYVQVNYCQVLWTFCFMVFVTSGALGSHSNVFQVHTCLMALDGQPQPMSVPSLGALQTDEVFTFKKLSLKHQLLVCLFLKASMINSQKELLSVSFQVCCIVQCYLIKNKLLICLLVCSDFFFFYKNIYSDFGVEVAYLRKKQWWSSCSIMV